MPHLWFALVFLAVVQGTFAGGGWIGCAEEGEAASRGLEVGGWDPALCVLVVAQKTPIYNHVNDARYGHPPRTWLVPGESVEIVGRDARGELLYFGASWISLEDLGMSLQVEHLPVVLSSGLSLISPEASMEPLTVAAVAYWNSWHWDPEGGGIWFRRSRWDASDTGHGKISYWIPADGQAGRTDYNLGGDVLAAPVGGAVLVRAWNEQTRGDVYILEADGTSHLVGTQCALYFTDAYVPFGRDAAWSPDGQYVVLKDRTGDFCNGGGITIYDRGGVVKTDLTDPQEPYQQPWYRNPNFTDQVGMDETCVDTPPGVELNESRNRCQWSPDRKWFATMPGAVDNPHVGDLLIYAADGSLERRFLVPGWPCNAFQWSPDSEWLAYGGPSGCA